MSTAPQQPSTLTNKMSPSVQMKTIYNKTGKHISLGSSDIVPVSTMLTRNMLDLSPLSSVTASYANVDFLAVPEPYKIIQSMNRLHDGSHKRSGSMVQMTEFRAGSGLDHKKTKKRKELIISHGKTFINEPKHRNMYRMSSCPSNAHALALKTFEEHNNAMLDERMKDIVERTENNLANSSPDHIL